MATEKVRDIPGWCDEHKGWANLPFKRKTSSAESHLLYRTARLLGPGNFADVGVFRGASTLCMAQGLRDGGHHGTIYGVDLFMESTTLDLNRSNNTETPELLEDYFNKNYWPDIKLALCVGDSSMFPRWLNEPFKFVFIDADHSYEGCKKDYLAWEQLIVPGGMLAFHDTNFDTVDQVIQEMHSHWEFVQHIFSIKIFKRTK